MSSLSPCTNPPHKMTSSFSGSYLSGQPFHMATAAGLATQLASTSSDAADRGRGAGESPRVASSSYGRYEDRYGQGEGRQSILSMRPGPDPGRASVGTIDPPRGYLEDIQAKFSRIDLGAGESRGGQDGRQSGNMCVERSAEADVRRVIKAVNNSVFSPQTEEEFEEVMEKWELAAQGAVELDYVLRTVVVRLAAPHLRTVVGLVSQQERRWTLFKDGLARTMFPISPYVRQLEHQIAKVDRSQSMVQAVHDFQRKIHRYGQLCGRWGRSNIYDELRQKECLLNKMPANRVHLYMMTADWESMSVASFIKHCQRMEATQVYAHGAGGGVTGTEAQYLSTNAVTMIAPIEPVKKRARFEESEDESMEDAPPLFPTVTSPRTFPRRFPSFDESKIRCYNCHKVGHRSRNCPEPPKICDSCGNKGHTSEICKKTEFIGANGEKRTALVRNTRNGLNFSFQDERSKKQFLDQVERYAAKQSTSLVRAKEKAKVRREKKKKEEEDKAKEVGCVQQCESESDVSSEEDDKIKVASVGGPFSTTPGLYVDMWCDGVCSPALLDTGSGVSLYPMLYWNKLSDSAKLMAPQVQVPRRKVVGATGDEIKIERVVELQIQIQKKVRLVRLLLTPTLQQPVLGRDGLIIFGISFLFKTGEFYIDDEELVLSEHPEMYHLHEAVSSVENEEVPWKQGEGAVQDDYEELVKVLESNRDVWETPKPGKCTVTKHRIELVSPTPLRVRVRRLNPSTRERLKSMIDEMLGTGVIRPSKSEWASAIVLVPKPDGSLRLCIDYRPLNSVTKRDNYPLPNITDLLDRLSESTVFSTLDLASGYHQVPMHRDSIPMTAFITPFGLFEFLVMPFGLINAPSTFQRTIDGIFVDFPQRENLGIYMDDIVIHSVDKQGHVEMLQEVLSRLRQHGLYINVKKTVLAARRIKYLGFLIEGGFQQPDPSQIEALTKLVRPKDQKSVRRFLGMAGYFRHFVRGYAEKSASLCKLTKKKEIFKWTDVHEEAWNWIKEQLAKPGIRLMLPHPGRMFVLDTDASYIALGAVLQQENEEGNYQPISFASKTLTSAERAWTVQEIEAYAIVWSVLKFTSYLKFQPHFLIRTDQKSLRWVWRSENRRILRWALLLQEYSFAIEYRRGSKQSHVDIFSRDVKEDDGEAEELDKIAVKSTVFALEDEVTPFDDRHFPTSEELINAQAMEDQEGTLPKNSVQIGSEEVWTTRSGKIYVPVCFRKAFLYYYHFSPYGAHHGVNKTFYRIAQHFWWPGLKESITEYNKLCLTCARRQQPPSVVLQGHLLAEQVGALVAIDLVGPLQIRDEVVTCLTVIDHFSKYAHAEVLQDVSAEQVWRKLLVGWIAYMGAPTCILSDNGTVFQSEFFLKKCAELGIKRKNSSPYHPQGNGIVESFHLSLKRAMFAMLRTTDLSIEEVIAYFLMAHRSTPHIATGETPYFILTGMEMGLPQLQDWRRGAVTEDARYGRYEHLDEIRREIFDVTARRAIQMTARKNSKVRGSVAPLSKKSLCIYLLPTRERKKLGNQAGGFKSVPYWSAPCRVVEHDQGNDRYKLLNIWTGDTVWKPRSELRGLPRMWPREELEVAKKELMADLCKVRNAKDGEKGAQRMREAKETPLGKDTVDAVVKELAKPESYTEEMLWDSSDEEIKEDELPYVEGDEDVNAINSVSEIIEPILTSTPDVSTYVSCSWYVVCTSWKEIVSVCQR